MFSGRPVQEVMLFLFCIYENRVRADQCHCLLAVFPACSQEGDHPHTPVNHSFPFPVSQELAMITGLIFFWKENPYLSVWEVPASIHVWDLIPSIVGSLVWNKIFMSRGCGEEWWNRTWVMVHYREPGAYSQFQAGWLPLLSMPHLCNGISIFPEQCTYSGDSMGPAFRLTSVQILEWPCCLLQGWISLSS